MDSDDEDESRDCSLDADLKRTSTGILSNRRPVSGRIPDSGSTTPEQGTPRLSLLSNAKREAAKRGLYSRFFRGPILGPAADDLNGPGQPSTSLAAGLTPEPLGDIAKKKRAEESPEERKERKRLKKELKEAKLLRKEARRARKAAKALESGEKEDKEFRRARKKLAMEKEQRVERGEEDGMQRKRKEEADAAPIVSESSASPLPTQSTAPMSDQVKDGPPAIGPVRKKKRKREEAS